MRVIVTGSAGFLGRRVCALLDIAGHKVIKCDQDEDVLTCHMPPAAAVIHLAANKYATDGEARPYETCMFNIDATAAALRMAPKVVLASTCKAADPITCYGASKLISERMVLNAGGTVLRLVNVLGSSGSVTDVWAQIPEGQPLPVTDCWRMFLHPRDAAMMLVAALDLPPGRYAPARARLTEYTMEDLARELYPGRDLVAVPLRVGDRPKERRLNEYEHARRHDDTFVRILDRWEAAADGAVADDRPAVARAGRS